MGNQNHKDKAASQGQKIVLRLRNRDIILHYAFKMKLIVSDIGVFPHELEGLRLWDSDIILARFVILESERFRSKQIMVFRAGVGVAGIALKKWTDCKQVVMCDTREEVVGNMTKNCQKNGVKDISCVKINLAELNKYNMQFDLLLCTDLLNFGYPPQFILAVFRKFLKVNGEAIIIMPERKQLARKFIDLVDRKEFKIINMILTADQYEASPVFNKIEGEEQFPLIGQASFYAITLIKLAQTNSQESIKNHNAGNLQQEARGIEKQQIIKLKPIVESPKPQREIQKQIKQLNHPASHLKLSQKIEAVNNTNIIAREEKVQQKETETLPISHMIHQDEEVKVQPNQQSPSRQIREYSGNNEPNQIECNVDQQLPKQQEESKDQHKVEPTTESANNQQQLQHNNQE